MGIISQMFLADMMASRRAQQDAALLAQQRAGLEQLLGSAPGLMGPGMDETGAELMGPPRQTGGAGLLADPTNLNRQVEFAGGVMALPGMQAQGSSLMSNILSQTHQNARAEAMRAQGAAQFQQEQERLSNQFLMTYDRDTYFDRQQDARASALHALNAELRTRQIAAEELGLEQANIEAQLGKAPTGYRPVLVQDTANGGQPEMMYAPTPGTPDHNKAVDTVSSTMSAVQNLDRLHDLVARSGSEAWGDESGAMLSLWTQAVADQARIKGLGTLQAGDIEFTEMGLENPGSWTLSRKSRLLRQIGEARRVMMRQVRRNQLAYRGYGINLRDYLTPGSQEQTLGGPGGTSRLEAPPPPGFTEELP